MSARIPPLDLAAGVQVLWPELMAALERTLRSTKFILGPEVEAFEKEVAAHLGSGHAVACNSGTDALVLALRALGVGPGDEVITSPFTFFATPEAVSAVGARPVFADIDPDTFNLDPACLERVVTERTRAVIPVHLFGGPCDLDAMKRVAERHGLTVVEDCAQAFGARWGDRPVGTWGHAGCFSFFPTKNLAGFGDGGMVVTDDEDLARSVRMLRVHGSRKKYHNEAVGCNSRLDEIQAALLRVKLPHLPAWNAARARAAGTYDRLLEGCPRILRPPLREGHVFNQYTVRFRGVDRDEVQARLLAAGVDTMVYYPVPCHRLKVYATSHAQVACPEAERASREVLSLPLWPEIPEATQIRVAETLRKVVGPAG